MKTLWQHANGRLYVVDHDSFGRILGAAGPLDPDGLQDLSEYRCNPGITRWIEHAIARNTLRRVNLRSAGT